MGGRQISRVYPILAAWTKKDISKRIKHEKQEGGSFGLGAVEEPLVRVRSHEGTSKDHNHQDEKSYNVPSCIENLVESAKEFAESYAKFSKAINDAKSKAPHAKVVCQMASLANALMEGFNLTQHNSQDTNGEVKEDTNGDDDMEECNKEEENLEVDDKEDVESIKLDKEKEKEKEKLKNQDWVAAAKTDYDEFFSDLVAFKKLCDTMDKLEKAFRPKTVSQEA